jgi:Ca2+-binding EF-hand superfamily protein
MQHGRAATGLLDQLNMFLVAHLKSVPEENLSTKIKETFQVIDIDGSGELNMQEVLTFIYSFSPTPPRLPLLFLVSFNCHSLCY